MKRPRHLTRFEDQRITKAARLLAAGRAASGMPEKAAVAQSLTTFKDALDRKRELRTRDIQGVGLCLDDVGVAVLAFGDLDWSQAGIAESIFAVVQRALSQGGAA